MSDLNLINTLQLKIFVTVAEERTLKAAAVKIGQTPSAISQNIKALENFLGVTLFERLASDSFNDSRATSFLIGQRASAEK